MRFFLFKSCNSKGLLKEEEPDEAGVGAGGRRETEQLETLQADKHHLNKSKQSQEKYVTCLLIMLALDRKKKCMFMEN